MIRSFFRRQATGPLRVMFVTTSMPVGGMETLLVELIRRLDRQRFAPELCCLKYLDVLGEELAREIPVHTGILRSKYDLRVLYRLPLLMRRRRIDAVVTVGTGGDKMFWGRLAAFAAGVPVICSALHSTGLPDRVERLNRLLSPITDAFIGVAHAHGRYLAEHEGCPAEKVRVISNGVDVARFRPQPGEKTGYGQSGELRTGATADLPGTAHASEAFLTGRQLGATAGLPGSAHASEAFLTGRQLGATAGLPGSARPSDTLGPAELRASLGLPEGCPVVGIVAALRPEKNHELFLEVARRVYERRNDVRFLIVGDGRRRGELESLAARLLPPEVVRFLGSRPDVPELLSLFDVFLLTSHMEANPVSILEAMACGKPVVAPRVGSIPESIDDGRTGLLFTPGDARAATDLVLGLLADRARRVEIGAAARQWVVRYGSVESMVAGYENLIVELFARKRPAATHRPIEPRPTIFRPDEAPSAEHLGLPGIVDRQLSADAEAGCSRNV